VLTEERIMFPLPGELIAIAQERGVAAPPGNERAAARAAGERGEHTADEQFRIRHH